MLLAAPAPASLGLIVVEAVATPLVNGASDALVAPEKAGAPVVALALGAMDIWGLRTLQG